MGQKEIDVGVKFTGNDSGFQRTVRSFGEGTAKISAGVSTLVNTVGSLAVVELASKAFEGYSKVMNSTEGSAEKLEQQISLLDGAMGGLMRTITTGSWDKLISNIIDTAKATREAKIATQEFEHASAGRTITRGELNIGLQESRVNAQEATNPKDKAGYLSEAVSFQKQITALNVSEISQRLSIDEEYYKKLTGHSKEYFEYFLKMVPTLAQNYDQYFGTNSVVLEGIKTRLSALSYDAFPSDKTKEEIHQLKLLRDVMEDYVIVQDDLSKKGQWDNYVKGIGEMKEAAAQGEKALVRLVKQLTTAEQAMAPLTKVGGVSKVNIGGKNDKEFARTIGELTGQAPGLQRWDTKKAEEEIENRRKGIALMEKETKELALQQEVANGLDEVFSSMFSNMDKGFEGMADAAVQAIGRIVEELLAKEAVIMLMNVLFPGSGTATSMIGNFLGQGGVHMHASGTNFAPGGLSLVGERGPELVNLPRGSQVIPNGRFGTQKIEIFGMQRGENIYWSNVRYANKLGQNT